MEKPNKALLEDPEIVKRCLQVIRKRLRTMPQADPYDVLQTLALEVLASPVPWTIDRLIRRCGYYATIEYHEQVHDWRDIIRCVDVHDPDLRVTETIPYETDAVREPRLPSTLMYEWVASLTPLERSVMELRYFEGKGVSEVAAALQRTKRAVEHTQDRGLEKLKRRIEQRYGKTSPLRFLRQSAYPHEGDTVGDEGASDVHEAESG